ncbi:unnamed protein product [Choristocarpus tenellus]
MTLSQVLGKDVDLEGASYKDLQAMAKNCDIRANQKRNNLIKLLRQQGSCSNEDEGDKEAGSVTSVHEEAKNVNLFQAESTPDLEGKGDESADEPPCVNNDVTDITPAPFKVPASDDEERVQVPTEDCGSPVCISSVQSPPVGVQGSDDPSKDPTSLVENSTMGQPKSDTPSMKQTEETKGDIIGRGKGARGVYTKETDEEKYAVLERVKPAGKEKSAGSGGVPKANGKSHEAGSKLRRTESLSGKALTRSRFDEVHKNLFASQRSIATPTPRKMGGIPKVVPGSASDMSSSKSRLSMRQTAVTPSERANTPDSSSTPSVGRRVTAAASKRSSVSLPKSAKKPTQVKEFSLSSNGKREDFAFKPYTGPVKPINGVPSLVDKTNVAFGKCISNIQDSQSKTPAVVLKNKPIKAILAAPKAQAARKSAYRAAAKTKRSKKLAESRGRMA